MYLLLLRNSKCYESLGLTIDLYITFADGILLVSQIEPFRVSFSGQLGENNNQRENEKWKWVNKSRVGQILGLIDKTDVDVTR